MSSLMGDKKIRNKALDIYRGLKSKNVTAILASGLVIGVVTASVEIAFATLVFSGDLSGYVANGIGLFLAGTIAAMILIGLTSSYPGSVAINQDQPAAIIAVVVAGIVNSMSPEAPTSDIYSTAVMAVILTSLLAGLLFFLLGQFRLGALFRFLPYPVIGGFLAGTGWLLVRGGFVVMADLSPGIERVQELFQQGNWLRWLPGVIFAIAILFITRRIRHYLVMPVMIFGAVGLFYLIVILLGIPIDQLSDQGWVLGSIPGDGLLQALPPITFSGVDWSAIFVQGGNIAAIIIVSTIALLLNASALELTAERDIRLDRELKASGLGTFVSGLVGGLVSYPSLSISDLSMRISGINRLVSLIVAGFLAVVLFLGAGFLSWAPKIVLGGLLMYLGLSFLDEWVVKAWVKFSKIDFAIIISILVVIAAVGFLEGVILGVVLAVALFVVSYSRVSVVKHAFSGAEFRSRVTRSHREREILDQESEEIYILQLQGFIFFGTANSLLDDVRARIESKDQPRLYYLIFDFRQVTGLDSTAVLSFSKMLMLTQVHGVHLVFTYPSIEKNFFGHNSMIKNFIHQFETMDDDAGGKMVHVFSDLDRGLEWCENQILLAAGIDLDEDEISLGTQLQFLLPDIHNLDRLLGYFEKMHFDPGSYLMKQGDPADALYFIESGQVTAQLEHPGSAPIRLEKMRGGRVVGEIGFYLNQPRTAAVIADESSTIYRLTLGALQKMERNDPHLAFAFHQGIIRLVAERLTHLTDTVNALQR